MITVRKSEDRGGADHGWLSTRHTFSFAHYRDPGFMGFRSLRVINEDHVAPGTGFGEHPHENMEIITYILSGALEHKDSLGTGSIIRPGDVQRMSAGTGVRHSEFNPSQNEEVHLLQIWILPNKIGIEPSYEQKRFNDEDKNGKLQLIGSQDGRQGSVRIHQDVNLYASKLSRGQEIGFSPDPKRFGWLQVARGEISVNDISLGAGDGSALGEETALRIRARSDAAEFLFFDLA